MPKQSPGRPCFRRDAPVECRVAYRSGGVLHSCCMCTQLRRFFICCGRYFDRTGNRKSTHLSQLWPICVLLSSRRGWDSNPCAPKDQRFSRPPRYDRSDTSPSVVNEVYMRAAISVNARNNFAGILIAEKRWLRYNIDKK